MIYSGWMTKSLDLQSSGNLVECVEPPNILRLQKVGYAVTERCRMHPARLAEERLCAHQLTRHPGEYGEFDLQASGT